MPKVRGLEFFPEGDRLLFFGDSGAYVWDPHSPWGFARRVSFGQVHAAAISDDGRLLAACSGRVAAVWAAPAWACLLGVERPLLSA